MSMSQLLYCWSWFAMHQTVKENTVSGAIQKRDLYLVTFHMWHDCHHV